MTYPGSHSCSHYTAKKIQLDGQFKRQKEAGRTPQCIQHSWLELWRGPDVHEAIWQLAYSWSNWMSERLNSFAHGHHLATQRLVSDAIGDEINPSQVLAEDWRLKSTYLIPCEPNRRWYLDEKPPTPRSRHLGGICECEVNKAVEAILFARKGLGCSQSSVWLALESLNSLLFPVIQILGHQPLQSC